MKKNLRRTKCKCGNPVVQGNVIYTYIKKDGTVQKYLYNHSQCQPCKNANKKRWLAKNAAKAKAQHSIRAY